jgi:hypothetical protein
VGFIATVAVTLYVTKIARQALENEVLEPESDPNERFDLN